ncbi:DUF4126 domain-containing protein [Parasphingopyxis sp.]|uniref:DUF4126 domain-containing protein n=1 Tax=Parasphingopyxis sp. TaxID=1920299 RepID=UPI00261228C9|nr:DUF4126 domain-containing protein [Parasphingopyxis sp.]
MSAVELVALAGSVSLLAGWRLYFVIFATGLAMRTGWIALPENLEMLAALANPWVIGVAGIGLVVEFFADKVAWLDSLWDGLHTLIRPVGGALLALAIVDANDPAWQIVALLLGGGGALLGHGAKASSRAAINASPEPFSNVVVSTGEDVATAGLTVAALANPGLAVAIFALVLLFTLGLLWAAGRVLKRVFGRRQKPS